MAWTKQDQLMAWTKQKHILPYSIKSLWSGKISFGAKNEAKSSFKSNKKTVNTNGQFVIVISVVANFSNTQKMVVSSF